MSSSQQEWLVGGGELGALVRETDWSSTALGPRDRWPGPLRTTISIVLDSRSPTVLFWGPQRLALYNDAYVALLGNKHPRAFGRPAAELGNDEPVATTVLDRGETLLLEERPIAIEGHGATTFAMCASPVRAEDGSIAGVLVALQETTIARDLERFRTLVENSRDGLNLLDLKTGRYLYMSPAQVAMTGFSIEEMNAFPREEAFARVHPDDRHVSVEQQQEVAAGRDPGDLPVEYRWRVRSGEYRWFSDTRKLVRDAKGQPVALVGVSRDITERKRAEEAHREGRQAFLLELSDALLQLADPDEIQLTAARLIGEHLHVVRALYAEIVDETVALVGRHYSRGVPPLAARIPLDLYSDDMIAAFKRGESVCVDDIATSARISEPARAALRAARVAAAMGTGLRKEGRWVAGLAVHSDVPRDWQSWEVTLVEETAERTWAALRRARAELAVRETEERLRVALQHTNISVFNQDRDLRYTWVFNSHPAFPPESVIGKTDADLFTPDAAARLSEIKRRILATGLPANEEISLEFSGETHWYDLEAEPLRDATGAIIGLTCATVDVTERKREAELLRETTEQLRDVDRRKTEFLAMLSHELRNPLGAIRNATTIVERVPAGSEQGQKAQAIITRQVDHMTHLIDDLLEATRITRGKIELDRERVDLAEILQRVAEDHAPEFARAGVELEVSPTPGEVWIQGDRIRLAQIVGNVLQNAAKFTPRGGTTTASLAVDATNRRAIVRVEDTGRGIPPELLPRVFEPFAQADTSLDRRLGGLGLGLAVAKGLVDLHGGTIEAKGRGADPGTIFEIVFPLDLSVPAAVQAHGEGPATSGHHVLVIEDNHDAADALCALLELDGHQVDVAYDGPQGLARARQSPPDVVICDIGLPEMNGLDVARAMRSDPELAGLTLVALTGYAQPEDVERTREAGFDAHLPKPLELDHLREVIAAAPHHVGDAR